MNTYSKKRKIFNTDNFDDVEYLQKPITFNIEDDTRSEIELIIKMSDDIKDFLKLYPNAKITYKFVE